MRAGGLAGWRAGWLAGWRNKLEIGINDIFDELENEVSTEVNSFMPDLLVGTLRKCKVIMSNQWNIHHDETHWPKLFQFTQERIFDHKGHLLPTQLTFIKTPFIPFARGKRPCLGQHKAQDILLICFASLL
ncbi:hypothetical protein DPMN_158511 [Dreissena polymorpha]|uniref:Cytochrome P450 n=1 Tax=Dreissena polymorpha TaxID=45954 RepID=A0A9D4EML2_DREPO|nr:hypothetical protein DPMN_158511 [Dreissena polymorpha]